MTDSDTTRYPAPPVEPPQPSEPDPDAASTPPTTPPSAEPAWRPPRADNGRNAAMVFGVIIVLVGLWFFATHTLDLDLPRLDWGQVWPVALIGLGAWIVISALRQRS